MYLFIHGCELQSVMNVIQMKWDVTGTIKRIFELILCSFNGTGTLLFKDFEEEILVHAMLLLFYC